MKPAKKGKKKKVKKQANTHHNDENEPPKMFDAIALNLFGGRGNVIPK